MRLQSFIYKELNGAYNCGGLLIMYDFLYERVAKIVASDPHDFFQGWEMDIGAFTYFSLPRCHANMKGSSHIYLMNKGILTESKTLTAKIR